MAGLEALFLDWLADRKMEKAAAMRGPYPENEEFRHGALGGRVCAVIAGLFFAGAAVCVMQLPLQRALAGLAVFGGMGGVFVWGAALVAVERVRFERGRVIICKLLSRHELEDGDIYSLSHDRMSVFLWCLSREKPIKIDLGIGRAALMVAMLRDRCRSDD